jgi:protein-disulfide isomerase
MKHFLFLSLNLVLLSACTSGSSDVSSRTPKGNPNAAVVVQEFADLQCPACRAAHSSIAAPLVEKYGDTIRFDHMHFPLRSIHRFALEAGEASECAADQGKFWEYVDLAFEKQQELSSEILSVWAQELELDMTTFNRCMSSHKRRDTVLADYEAGRALDVRGTPTFFVNGERVQTGFDTISETIDAELERLTQRL